MTKDAPLILLPAFMTTRTLWRAQVAALSDTASIDVVELSPYDLARGRIVYRYK